MPLPHSRRSGGLATGLWAAFEEAGAPFAITFLRGAAARVTAPAGGRAEPAAASPFRRRPADRAQCAERAPFVVRSGRTGRGPRSEK